MQKRRTTNGIAKGRRGDNTGEAETTARKDKKARSSKVRKKEEEKGQKEKEKKEKVLPGKLCPCLLKKNLQTN